MSTLLDELRSRGFVKTLHFTDRETGERTSKDVVRYDGLLYAAKQAGLSSIQTKLVQAPSEQNGWTTICHARVETKAGVFTGIGDANPKNVTPKIRPHAVRMAETRAKARALRDSVDLQGIVCLEELDDVGGSRTSRSGNGHEAGNGSYDRHSDSQRPRYGHGNGQDRSHHQGEPRLMSEKQRRFLFRLLAEEGIEGDSAVEALCGSFETRDLRTVTSAQASRLIDSYTGQNERVHSYGG